MVFFSIIRRLFKNVLHFRSSKLCLDTFLKLVLTIKVVIIIQKAQGAQKRAYIISLEPKK
jgi:hypothetical protein